jgi:hypothetical protein
MFFLNILKIVLQSEITLIKKVDIVENINGRRKKKAKLNICEGIYQNVKVN